MRRAPRPSRRRPAQASRGSATRAHRGRRAAVPGRFVVEQRASRARARAPRRARPSTIVVERARVARGFAAAAAASRRSSCRSRKSSGSDVSARRTRRRRAATAGIARAATGSFSARYASLTRADACSASRRARRRRWRSGRGALPPAARATRDRAPRVEAKTRAGRTARNGCGKSRSSCALLGGGLAVRLPKREKRREEVEMRGARGRETGASSTTWGFRASEQQSRSTRSSFSHVEGFAAAARILDIGIVELEPLVQALAREVELGAVEIRAGSSGRPAP